MSNHIVYKKGYRYQLHETYIESIEIKPLNDIITEFIELTYEGNLIIKRGYAWDGPSGPTIRTKNFMRGSLVHDALYQLMREKYLDHNLYRKVADMILRRIIIKDGMSSVRALWVYYAVRLFADHASNPNSYKGNIIAPGVKK